MRVDRQDLRLDDGSVEVGEGEADPLELPIYRRNLIGVACRPNGKVRQGELAGVDYLANKIEVGTQHVARVRRLIAATYGPEAPFEVVFARPAVLL